MIKEENNVEEKPVVSTESPIAEEEATINGRPLQNINIVCSKHGVINNGAFYIRYTSFKKDEADATKTVAIDNNNIFCISCLNEIYMNFQKEGKVGKISLGVKYKDEDGLVKEASNIAVEDADISVKETPEA